MHWIRNMVLVGAAYGAYKVMQNYRHNEHGHETGPGSMEDQRNPAFRKS